MPVRECCLLFLRREKFQEEKRSYSIALRAETACILKKWFSSRGISFSSVQNNVLPSRVAPRLVHAHEKTNRLGVSNSLFDFKDKRRKCDWDIT